MNIFRKLINGEDLVTKLEAYENQIQELDKSYAELLESNQKLTEQVIELTQSLQSKEVAIEEKEQVIEEKEEVIEQLEDKIEEKEEVIEKSQEMIQEVIENTSTVEKQAAIKALEILADCGMNESVEVIEAPEEIDIMAQMKKLKGKELVDFYQANKQEYLSNLRK